MQLTDGKHVHVAFSPQIFFKYSVTFHLGLELGLGWQSRLNFFQGIVGPIFLWCSHWTHFLLNRLNTRLDPRHAWSILEISIIIKHPGWNRLAVFLLICHIRLKYSTIERKQLENKQLPTFFITSYTYVRIYKRNLVAIIQFQNILVPLRLGLVSVRVRGWGYDISVVEWQSELESGWDWVSGLYVTGTYTASNCHRILLRLQAPQMPYL